VTARLFPDHTTFGAPTGGDHHDRLDIERVFRDSYGRLVQEADAQLQGVARPSGVVSRAFIRAWNERERFDTAEALEAYLHSAVREGALRERFRRAVAHRPWGRAAG